MFISTNKDLHRIESYIKKKGWTDDYVILNNIVCDLEKNGEGDELLELINNYDTCKCREFFYKFKKFVTDKKGKRNLLRLENVWQAFDSAMAAY